MGSSEFPLRLNPTDRELLITVYHRDDLPGGALITDCLERLHTLHEEGVIDRFEHTSVPGRTIQSHGSGTLADTVVEELREAAASVDATLEPCLDCHTRINQFTGLEEEIVVLPALAVIIRDADSERPLIVAPSIIDGISIAVDDIIALLEQARE